MDDSNKEEGYYGLRNLSVMDDEESRIEGNCIYLKQIVINDLWPYIKAGEPAAAYVVAVKEWLKEMEREEVLEGIKKWVPEFLDHEVLIPHTMTEEEAFKKYMQYLEHYAPALRGEKNEHGIVSWVNPDYKQAVTDGTVEAYARKESLQLLTNAERYQKELPEDISGLIEDMIEIYDLIMKGENFLQHSSLEEAKRQLVKTLKPIFNWSAPDETEPPPMSEIDGKENLT